VDPPKKPEGNLRTGFTTGTSATAASVAAVFPLQLFYQLLIRKKLIRLMFYFQKNLESKLISIVVNLKKTRRIAR